MLAGGNVRFVRGPLTGSSAMSTAGFFPSASTALRSGPVICHIRPLPLGLTPLFPVVEHLGPNAAVDQVAGVLDLVMGSAVLDASTVAEGVCAPAPHRGMPANRTNEVLLNISDSLPG